MNALINGWILILVRDQFVCAQQVDAVDLLLTPDCWPYWHCLLHMSSHGNNQVLCMLMMTADHNLTVSQGVGTQVVVQIPGNGFNVDTALSRCK